MESDHAVWRSARLAAVLLPFLMLLFHFAVQSTVSDQSIYPENEQNCILAPGPLARCYCGELWNQTDRHVSCDGQNLRAIPSNITQLVDLKITNDDIEVLREIIPYTDLVTLHLASNRIRYVPDSTFRNLAKLKTLSLSDNEISNLSPKTFDGLVTLELLVLTGNKIYEIRAATFTGSVLPNLQILKLDHCAVQQIDPNSFSGLAELESLNLAFNRLQRLPVLGDEKQLRKLKNLDVSDNLLDRVEGSSFVHLPSLTNLLLSRNLLTELTRDTFQSLNDSLVWLSLRGNRISSIGANSLYPLRELKALDLSFNLLTRMNSSEPPWDALDKLLVHDNPWDCGGCDNSWLVDEDAVMSWNSESNVSCASPGDLRGRSVYVNGSAGSIFDHCKPANPSPQAEPPSNVAVVTLVIIGMSILFLTFVLFVVIKCRGRRSNKKKGKANGETKSLAYSKMASTSPFAIGDDDDEQEEL